MLAAEMMGGASIGERKKYLAPTPEGFLALAKLLGCKRMYRSPVYDELYELVTSGYPRIIILAPRGSFKSTILEISNTREILLNAQTRILYTSETLAQAVGYVGWTREQFESNVQLKKLFGDYKPARKGTKPWGTEAFTVAGRTDLSKKEATLTAKGLEQVRAGQHYERIIIDDPCSGENTKTRDALQTTIEAFKLIFSIAEVEVDEETQEILSRTQVVLSCTRYDDGDVMGFVKEMNAKILKAIAAGNENLIPWRIFEVPAELKDGTLPYAHLTRGILDQLRIGEQGGRVYAAQYLLDPVPSSQAMFRREQFKVISRRDIPKPEYLYRYLFVDTGTGGEKENCMTCAVVIGRDATGRDFVEAMVAEPMKPSAVVETMFSMYQQWGCRKLLMEKNMVNDCYGAMIDARCIQDQVRVRVEKVMGRTTESKEHRIEALTIPLENGTLYFSNAIDHELIHVQTGSGLAFGEIVDQFVRFPRAKRKDIPDAMSDLNKRDKKGALLCRRPMPSTAAAPKAQIVNGKFVGAIQAQVATMKGSGDLWGKLQKQVRGGGAVGR